MAVNKTINIDLDLKRVTPQALDIPKLVEGDTGNIFVITLTDDGLPVDLSACRVLVVFSKVSDSTTSEQDTEDGYIDLYYYGIELIGPSPSNGDTITVTSDGVTATAVTDVVGAVVTIDPEGWLERVKDPGTYTITYVTAGSAWQLRPHTVTISGANHNIVTIDLQTTSYGAGKNNCEIQIYSGDAKDILVTTAQFNFDGRKGISNAETITRDPSYPLLVSLIAQVRSLIGKTGDMSKTDYDPQELVRIAGGIPDYVDDELTDFASTYFPLSVANGGTGADNAGDARANLVAGQNPVKLGPMTLSSLPSSFIKSEIKSTMSLISIHIATPSALTSPLSWTTYDGSVSFSGSLATGASTTITAYFAETR